MFAKVLVSGSIMLATAVGMAAPAIADHTADHIGPSADIGLFALNCANPLGCAPANLADTPTVNPQQMTQAINNGFSAPNDFSDLPSLAGLPALNCAGPLPCPPASPAPVDPQQMTQEIQNGFSRLNDFSDLQGQR